ncbi:hypothetical protein A3D00_01675 [Candidatus Woesebacteria bacterium RIFCSPHIGHO2_02_FULL_38_9]|uniref:Antitoxin n=1 Tax=Candidatus Woesebacteria bacterium RIFCSPHIGHO2_01_FULL_39_28 TaxID=1802496 RepID=A0A1F7YFM0_9BACT|nr:MAG: hypothetical protein A2627_03775 [Candidatus Woesebacteria bacterium RIFCSPHIGHO2_01_FULL_39_28]OGM33637.1 MAG: hypothetical protein A3D00_01675 [Candidatus Woesebacteria bacterium RIFCSPHIGHO2_02_FULL_38_9]OGM58542.1 MAG: hypothetical protein A3A50_00785 [Candidatus Woesebacteria bacterium RIFCSPLOWO2_01_FULL_38_20]
MKVISASEARNNFSEILSLVAFRGEEFEIKRKGKILAAIVPKKNASKKKSEIRNKLKAIDELSQISLKIPDNWEEVEKLLSDLHDPHI